MNQKTLERLGYLCPRLLPDGQWAALRLFVTTAGLCVGIDETGCYRRRFCYELASEALSALDCWNGRSDPPGPWLVEKPADRWSALMVAKMKR